MTAHEDDLRALLPDWKRHLRARNKAPNTIITYLRSAAHRPAVHRRGRHPGRHGSGQGGARLRPLGLNNNQKAVTMKLDTKSGASVFLLRGSSAHNRVLAVNHPDRYVCTKLDLNEMRTLRDALNKVLADPVEQVAQGLLDASVRSLVDDIARAAREHNLAATISLVPLDAPPVGVEWDVPD